MRNVGGRSWRTEPVSTRGKVELVKQPRLAAPSLLLQPADWGLTASVIIGDDWTWHLADTFL